MPEQDYDRELDDALAALYADAHVDTAVQARVRAELMRAAETSTSLPVRKRRAMPIAAVAAAVAVVAVGAVLVVTSQPAEVGPALPGATMQRPPATSDTQHAPMPPMPDQPQNTLHTLATRVTDLQLASTQYRYVSTHLWLRQSTEGASRKPYTYIAEVTIKTWIPADQQQEWLRRAQTLPNRQWLIGSEQEARADGALIDAKLVRPDGETRARCGEFMPEPGKEPCRQRPLPDFAGTGMPPPTDVRKLYELLATESAAHADPPLRFFRSAAGLFNAYYPAAVRRAVIEAVSRHPHVTIEDAKTRDNRPAISVGIAYGPDGNLREELLLDPANGQLIGRRTVCLKDIDGAKAGDIIRDEVQHQAVTGEIGVEPPR